MSSIKQLKKNHGYVNKSDTNNTCRNCIHRRYAEQYTGIDGISANLCEYLYNVEDEGMVILLHVNGVCNEHE